MKKIIKPAAFLVVAAIAAALWMLHFHSGWISPHLPGWAQSMAAHIAEAPLEAVAETGDVDPSKTEVPVRIAAVARTTLHRYIDAFGVIAPRPARTDQQAGSAAIAAPAAGIVAEVMCQISQPVKKGDVLIQLDDRQAKAAEDQAAAALAQAQAALASLKATPRPQQLDVARLAVQKSQIALDLAQKNNDRQKLLAADQGTSAKSVEQAAGDLASAQNDLASSQQQLALLQATPTAEDLAQENAKVAQAQAGLAAAQVQRQTLKITAPIDGIVSQVNVNAGEAVDSTKTLVEIIAPDRLMVDADVPEEQLSLLSVGEAVTILPEKNVPDAPAPTAVGATITYISPQIERKTGTIEIGIDLPPGGDFRSGQTVRVGITAATHKDCLAVPKQSVVKDDDGKTIICLVQGDTAVHKKVVAGLTEGDLTEITADGVEGGNFVVTDGASGLMDGAKIKQIDDSAKDAD